MKAGMALRLGLAIAGILMAGSALAQGPGDEPGAGSGFAQHRPPFERAFGGQGIQGRWWNNPRIVERLKLTDEQRKAFDEILYQHRETLIDLRGSLEKAELTMQPLIRDDLPNEAKILAQIDKVAQARAELEKANARYLLALRSKLTPEQWKMVQDFRANRGQEGRGQGRGGWGQGGQGPGGQYRRQMPPAPPSTPPAAAPQGAGPQSMVDEGVEPNGPAAPGAGTAQ
ncbi:MAG: Spy/CpxP family protein refolding chaperone [Terracidiphilus sp.]